MPLLGLTLFALLGVPKLQLIVLASLISPLFVAFSSKRIKDAVYLPIVLVAGVIPFLVLALTWTELRLPIFASVATLLSLAYFSKRIRHVLHFLTILLVGVIPFFLFVAVEDFSWSAGFL